MLEASLVRSRNGAPSRKGCVVNGRMTKASNKSVPPSIPHPISSWYSKMGKTQDLLIGCFGTWKTRNVLAGLPTFWGFCVISDVRKGARGRYYRVMFCPKFLDFPSVFFSTWGMLLRNVSVFVPSIKFPHLRTYLLFFLSGFSRRKKGKSGGKVGFFDDHDPLKVLSSGFAYIPARSGDFAWICTARKVLKAITAE